jgi:hypothetical protein
MFFGGHNCIATFFHEVWVLAFDDSTLSSGRWIQLHPDSSRGAPENRSHYGSAYDPATNRLYIHSGSPSLAPLVSLWVLEHANGLGGTPAWRRLSCSGGGPSRNDESMVFDPTTNSALTFGGMDTSNVYKHDIWRLSGLKHDARQCTWKQLTTGANSPGQRVSASLLVDPATGAVILFGGEFEDAGFTDAWLLRDRRRK